MARTKQYARRNACGLPAIRSRPRSLDSRIGAHEPQHADDDVEQRDDTDELEDRPRSQSEHVHDTRSVSPDSNLLRPSSSGPGVEDPTEPNIQNKFRMNADFHLDDDNSDDDSNDDDTPPPPEKANKFSTRPDGFASSATQGTILNADDDSAQSSQNNSNHFGSVPPTCDSASAALPKEMDQTEAKEKDVKYDTTRTNNKKRILAPTSEEGENDPRVKKGKFHSVDEVDVTKSSHKAVEPLQQVVNESSDGSDVTKESVKAIEPANGKDDDKTDDLNENTAAQEFTHGAFLDFETIPGSPIQAFDSAALKAEQMTMADEFDAKLTSKFIINYLITFTRLKLSLSFELYNSNFWRIQIIKWKNWKLGD